MDDIPIEGGDDAPAPAPEAEAAEVRRPDGRVLRPVGPESEARGGPETPGDGAPVGNGGPGKR